jgi:hypothetical protein
MAVAAAEPVDLFRFFQNIAMTVVVFTLTVYVTVNIAVAVYVSVNM